MDAKYPVSQNKKCTYFLYRDLCSILQQYYRTDHIVTIINMQSRVSCRLEYNCLSRVLIWVMATPHLFETVVLTYVCTFLLASMSTMMISHIVVDLFIAASRVSGSGSGSLQRTFSLYTLINLLTFIGWERFNIGKGDWEMSILRSCRSRYGNIIKG